MLKLSPATSGASRAAAVLAAIAAAVVMAGCAAASPAASASPPGSPAARQPSSPAGPPSAGPAPDGTASAAGSPAGRVSPAGFRVLSMSFVSDQQGWALGTVPCGTGRCLSLLGTADGGAAWHQLAAPTREPGSVYSTCPNGSPCVQQVRFATPLIGYAYDPSLFLTTDGGRTWSAQPGADTSSLETADGTVDRVESGAVGCAGQPYKFLTAPAGGLQWLAAPAPEIATICPPVLYRQGQRLILAGYGNPAGGVRATAQLGRSADGGQSWVTGLDNCGGSDGYASGVALAPPDVLVLLCEHQAPEASGAFGPAWVRVSVNGGASFGPDETIPPLVTPQPGELYGYQLVAASAGRLLVTETDLSGRLPGRVLLTGTGGQSWTATLSLPAGLPVLLVGYEDPDTGRIAQGGTVWTTRDGGASWVADSF